MLIKNKRFLASDCQDIDFLSSKVKINNIENYKH